MKQRFGVVETRLSEGWIEQPVRHHELDEWLAECREVLALRREICAEDDSIKHWADVGRALQHLARALSLSQEWEEALITRREQLAVWERLGRAQAAFVARMHMADVLDVMGQSEEADALLERCASESEEDAFRFYRDPLAERQAVIAARRGKLNEARAHAVYVMELREAIGNAQAIERAQVLLDQIDVAQAMGGCGGCCSA